MALGLANGRVEIFVHHHGPDDIGGADWLTCAPKRVEDAARQFSLLEPEIGSPDPLRRNRLRLQIRSEKAKRGVEMNEIGAALTELALCLGDDARNLGALRHQRGCNVALRQDPGHSHYRRRSASLRTAPSEP